MSEGKIQNINEWRIFSEYLLKYSRFEFGSFDPFGYESGINYSDGFQYIRFFDDNMNEYLIYNDMRGSDEFNEYGNMIIKNIRNKKNDVEFNTISISEKIKYIYIVFN